MSISVAKMKDNYNFVLSKIEQGDADYEAGRIVSMEDAERRMQAVIDRSSKRKKG